MKKTRMNGPSIRHCRWLPVAVFVCLLGGCGSSDEPRPAQVPTAAQSPAEAAPEQTLAEQIAAVERGESWRIEVSQSALTDQDLIEVSQLAGLRELLVDHPESSVELPGIVALASQGELVHFRLRGRGIDDQCLRELARCQSLRVLNVPQGRFGNEALAALADLPLLEQLRFGSPLVTDEGMPALATFPALLRLHLIDVPITDAGLSELAKLKRLQSLYIDGGNISDAAWDELFRQRPKLHVHVNSQHLDRDPGKHEH